MTDELLWQSLKDTDRRVYLSESDDCVVARRPHPEYGYQVEFFRWGLFRSYEKAVRGAMDYAMSDPEPHRRPVLVTRAREIVDRYRAERLLG